MNPIIWGLAAALSWGTADFIARFTSHALGAASALLGMLVVGSLVAVAVLYGFDLSIALDWPHAWLLLVTGIGIMLGSLFLYWGLARGPVTVVAPIFGAYPAINIVITLFWGLRPSLVQWVAFAVVLIGVAIVARAARSFDDGATYTPKQLNHTILISLAAAVAMAFGLAGAQAAIPYYGEFQTVAAARWISLAACVLFFVVRQRGMPILPFKWWPLIILQGLLDGGAYLFLLLGSEEAGAAMAIVISACFSSVTVILARVFLREAMTWGQWIGIAAVVTGIAVLSAN